MASGNTSIVLFPNRCVRMRPRSPPSEARRAVHSTNAALQALGATSIFCGSKKRMCIIFVSKKNNPKLKTPARRMDAHKNAFDILAERIVEDAKSRGTYINSTVSGDTASAVHIDSSRYASGSPRRRIPIIADDSAHEVRICRDDPDLKRLLKDHAAQAPACIQTGNKKPITSKTSIAKSRIKKKAKASQPRRPHKKATPSASSKAKPSSKRMCLVLYGQAPMLRIGNSICRLVVHSSSSTSDISAMPCEWYDTEPLSGKVFKSLNAACEAMRQAIEGPPPPEKRRWTINVWTTLTISLGGSTIQEHKKSGKGFSSLLQPQPTD